jgi:hypothetical protein
VIAATLLSLSIVQADVHVSVRVDSGLGFDQLPTKPLMKALPKVVGHEFLDDVPEMSLAEKNERIAVVDQVGSIPESSTARVFTTMAKRTM